jgi:hypothetical protein
MPRHDHRLQASHVVRPSDAPVIALLLTEINVLREALHLPTRTVADLHATLCSAARAQARSPRDERGQ